jgi:hypothetical protein
MSNPIHKLTDKAIAFQIPKNAYGFRIDTGGYVCMKWEEDRVKDPLAEYYDEETLPPGQWSLLGKASELTEEQWRGIVDRDKRKTSNGLIEMEISGFKDYERFGGSSIFRVKSTAIESGLSLLKSHNLAPETTLILTNTTISNE